MREKGEHLQGGQPTKSDSAVAVKWVGSEAGKKFGVEMESRHMRKKSQESRSRSRHTWLVVLGSVKSGRFHDSMTQLIKARGAREQERSILPADISDEREGGGLKGGRHVRTHRR